MILAIVGTRSFSSCRALEYASLLVEHEVRNLRWDSFITGDPEYSNDNGVDALCVQWCAVYDRPCETYAPENRRWQPGGFKARNILLAVTCDEMLCIRNPGTATYGSGWTADHTETLGKPVTRILIS